MDTSQEGWAGSIIIIRSAKGHDLGWRATAPQAMGIILPKLPTPLTDGFMRHSNATLAQELLHVAVAQGETIVKPDPVADDCTGKAVVLVARGVGRRGHAWVSILGFI